jgi:hypothetical protein
MHPLFWLYWLAAFFVVVSVLAILAVVLEGETMTAENRMLRALWGIIILVVVLAIGSVALASWAFAHDHDHPELDRWYAGLMQPDNPTASCCGRSDAYWCDDYYARDGKAYCKITDDREVAGRPPVPVGTEIEIPPWKLKFDRGNPTGHAVVFLSSGGAVFCFVQSSGS